jgi:mono/diheme cytochrome c family protein
MYMKKFIVVITVITLVGLGLLGFSGTISRQDGLAESVKRGQTVYSQSCIACHQPNGAGIPNLYPPLIKTKWVLGDKNELIKIVLNGLTGEIKVNDEVYNNAMPPHSFLTDDQVADVLTYVRNSFGNKATAVKPAEVKSNRAKAK